MINKIKKALGIKKEHKKKGYVIHSTGDISYELCRVLKSYKTEDEAETDLIKLLAHKITDEDLLDDEQI